MNDMFHDLDAESGWTPDTQVAVLLEYIENQHDDGTFEDFLKQKVAEEKKM